MGLDMYLQGRKTLYNEANRTEDGFPVTYIVLEFGYWRKFFDLHNFITERIPPLYNQADRYLNKGRIEQIMCAIKSHCLYESAVAYDDSEEEHLKEQVVEDLKPFQLALEWLNIKEPNTTKAVYYHYSD